MVYYINMRILLIHNYYQFYGGEDTYFDSLVKLLKKKNHKIYIYTKTNNDINDNLFKKIQIAQGLYSNKKVEQELSNIIKSFRPHIAHISNLFPLITSVAYDVCKKNKVPVVQSMHTFRYLCPKGTLFRNNKICELCVTKNFAYPSVYYHCYNNSILASAALSSSFFFHNIRNKLKSLDRLIFPSEAAREYHVKHLELDKEKTKVIPNFIEDPKIKSTKKGDYFIFVGRFAEEKNILWLLEVFSSIPQFKLLVVGNGPLYKEVSAYKKYPNIGIKINIPKKEVYDLISKAICTIIPSPVHYEFGPIVMMESFACGTPVLVPRGGIFLDRVKEGKTGFFYKSNDRRSLILKVKEINRKQIVNMSNNVREDYERKYTSDKHHNKLQVIYSNVLKNKDKIF